MVAQETAKMAEKDFLANTVGNVDDGMTSKESEVEVKAPRLTHQLIHDTRSTVVEGYDKITEGNRKTQSIIIWGLIGLLLMLAANFGLSALAVFLQKDVYVANQDGAQGATLSDGKGNSLSVEKASYTNDDLISLPIQDSSYLSTLETLYITTDQGNDHLFWVSHAKFMKKPGDTEEYEFSLTSKSGYVLTWHRALLRHEEGGFVHVDDSAGGITITHPLEQAKETLSFGSERRLLRTRSMYTAASPNAGTNAGKKFNRNRNR